MNRWAWRICLAVGAALVAAYYVVPPVDAKLVVWPVVGLSCAAAMALATRWHRPASPLAWYLLAAALAFITIGDTLYNIRVRLLHNGQVFPSVVDLFYLLGFYPCVIAGLLLLIRRRGPGRDLPSLIDAAMITIAAGLLSWVFLIDPYIHAAELSLIQRLVSIAYPLGDVLVLAMAARLAIGSRRRAPAWWLLAGGLVPLLVADSLFVFLQIQGTWRVGGPVDVGWMAFYLCWAAAALHPSMVKLSQPEPASLRMSGSRLLLVGGASLLAPLVLAIQGVRGQPVDATMISAVAATLFLLSLARMGGLTSELAAQRERERILQRAVDVTKTQQARVAVDLRNGPVEQLDDLVRSLGQVRRHLAVGNEADADKLLGRLEDRMGTQITDLRRMMSELRPPVLEQLGIARAVRTQVEAFTNQTGVPCAFEATNDAELPSEVEAVLYRVIQEGLTNISRHASASHVSVSLQADRDLVRLQIHDDGTGFEPADSPRQLQRGHYGLASLQEWVDMLRGRLMVSSTPGHGTTVTVELALQTAQS